MADAAPLRIAVLDDYQGVATTFADWSSVGEVHVFRDNLVDEDALVGRLRGFPVVVAMRERTPFGRSLLTRLDDLRLLVTTGRRNAAIDVAAATERGIVVSGTDSLVSPTAELTWGLILALARRIPTEDRAVRAGAWQSTIGRGLEGATLSLLGLGRLGERVARVGLAMGMDVVAWSQNLTDGRAEAVGVERVTKEQLFARADVLSIHVRLSERTRGVVGAAELAALPEGALVVNTSRAEVIDVPALVDAVHAGRLGGVALDVHPTEPLAIDDPLRNLPDSVLTPHIGYVTKENYELVFTQAVEAVAAWRDGAPIRLVES